MTGTNDNKTSNQQYRASYARLLEWLGPNPNPAPMSFERWVVAMNEPSKLGNGLTFEGWHGDEKETFTGVDNDSFGNDCRDHDQDAWNFEIDESDCWK